MQLPFHLSPRSLCVSKSCMLFSFISQSCVIAQTLSETNIHLDKTGNQDSSWFQPWCVWNSPLFSYSTCYWLPRKKHMPVRTHFFVTNLPKNPGAWRSAGWFHYLMLILEMHYTSRAGKTDSASCHTFTYTRVSHSHILTSKKWSLCLFTFHVW